MPQDWILLNKMAPCSLEFVLEPLLEVLGAAVVSVLSEVSLSDKTIGPGTFSFLQWFAFLARFFSFAQTVAKYTWTEPAACLTRPSIKDSSVA